MSRLQRASRAAFAAALFALFVSGCASMRYHSAYNEHVYGVVQNHVYDQPIEQVWPAARTLLFEMGYQVRESDPGVFVLETEWLEEVNSSGATTRFSRYLVQGTPFEGGRSQVQFILDNRSRPDAAPSTARDLETEWLLLQRVDPDLAARIQADADAAGQRAVQDDS